MELKSRKEILKNLFKDTSGGYMIWDVFVDNQFIKTSHKLKVTETKSVSFKIVYYKNHPKSTKLYISYEFKNEHNGHSISILDLGGKKRQEADDVLLLLKTILSENEYKNPEFKDILIEINDKFKIGDRVVVIKAQDFDGDEIGQKGNIVKEITNKHNILFYLIRFDNEFDACEMLDDDFDFDDKKLKKGNCWAFRPEYIKKISQKKESVTENLALNQKVFMGLILS